jgi:hypothetical protein
MADVTGSIGNEYVELNNAATEVTLKQLLAAVQKQGGSTGAVGSTAGAAGVNAAAVEAAKASTKAQNELAEKAINLKKTFSELAAGMMQLGGKLLDGTDKSSDLFSAFERLPGVAGMVASGFAKVARFQEENLDAYQKITDAGVSFGGSLTDMRTAAASTYMTLEQFSGLMKRNSETFAKLGGTVDQGARAFVGLSNSLMKSETGDQLRALGFTTVQVNEGLAGYLAVTGGRNQKEMQNTAAMTKGAGEYLTQLDALAAITGKSREEQEKALKEASANSAYEAMMQGLDEEGKKKATIAMQNALATGGKAGADLLKSQMLGLPPMTEAAQKLQAMGPSVAAGIKQMGDAVTDTGKSMKDVEKGRAAAQVGASKDAERLGKSTLAAMSFMSGPDAQTAQALQRADNVNKQQGIKTQEDAENQMKTIAAEQKKRKESEAADAVLAQKAMQELGQTILSALLPIIKILTPVINVFAQVITIIAKQFEKLNGWVQLLVLGVVAVVAAFKLMAAQAAAKSAADALSGGGGGGGGGGKTGGGLKGAMGSASKFAKLGGAAGAMIGGVSLYNSFGDINDKVKAGKMSEEEASKEKAGAVGETGGGMAGGIAGAAAGAAIGSVVPVIGTIIGGLIGGALGSYGGSSLGKSAADSLTGQKKAADGLMVNTPTSILAGEAGPEIVAPTRHFENLQNELQTLNKQTAEMLRYLKETAEYTRNSNDSIKNLGGDLFKF